MLTCLNQLAVKQVRLANCLFLGQLLFAKPQGLSAIARATVSSNYFIESKHALCFDGRLLCVSETALVIAGLYIVIGQSFESALRILSMPLKTFGRLFV